MKSRILILLSGFLFTNCLDQQTEKKEYFFRSYIDLEITHTDDKYGEWGGDTDVVHIYYNGENMLVDYSSYLGSMESPSPPKPNEKPQKWYEYKKLDFKVDSLKLNPDEIQLVQTSILDLVKYKIENPERISHSGIYNSVVSKDSSLIIKNYPSFEWESFQKLKRLLKTK
jgi:hypothetical protein